MPKTKDLYEVLGVAKTASQDEIKAEFRKLARKFHPDMNPGDKAAERLAHLADAMNKSGAIGEYSVMAKFTDGMGGRVQAHHILEVQMAKRLKLGNTDKMPSVILTDAEHKAITAKLKTAETAKARSAQELWDVYRKAYHDHPDWLEAIKPYLMKGK